MVEALVTYGFTLHSRIHYHATWFWRWSWDGLWTLFLGSQDLIVTALGSCAKWPFVWEPPHTQDWEPVTIKVEALSLVEKAKLVQVRFTLRLRDERSKWMYDGCKVYTGFLHNIKWIKIHGHLDYFHKPPRGGRPNTKLGDHGTLNAHNHGFILIYHAWGSAWVESHWNNIWLRARSHMASHYTWGSVTTLHDFGGVLGRPLDTFFWALTISWSRLLACVRSGPTCEFSQS